MGCRASSTDPLGRVGRLGGSCCDHRAWRQRNVIFVGDDWAEAHHDIYLCDAAGARLAAHRFPEGIEAISGLHELIATHADDPAEVAVGIETDRGLWVQSLIEAGYRV